eukprot:12525.XXX_46633_46746_1 [CDS] Oithona nana genome sequencing.
MSHCFNPLLCPLIFSVLFRSEKSRTIQRKLSSNGRKQ